MRDDREVAGCDDWAWCEEALKPRVRAKTVKDYFDEVSIAGAQRADQNPFAA
jgi:hypothetical protein